MIRVFKRNVLADIPAGAVVAGEGEERAARWTDGGRRRTATVVSTRLSAAKGGGAVDRIIVGQEPVYSGKVKLGPKHWRTVRLYSDKVASERELARLQGEADRHDAGCTSADVERLRRPIAELAKDYIANLKAQNKDTDHVRISEWMLDKLIDLGGWRRFGDITRDSMERILAKLEETKATASYRNKFIKRAKAFVHALLPDGWADPLKKVRHVREKGAKRTRARRAAGAEDLVALCSIDLSELSEYRRLAYALAGYNGLRRNELEDLRWKDVHLDATIPFAGLPQKQGQDDSHDFIPLHPYVLSLLATAHEDRHPMPEAKVLPAVPDVKTLKKDLTAAGLPFANADGERLDFHALRHTFETLLDRTACSRATKKKLMRHANEDVTDGYAHAELAEMLTALARLTAPVIVVEEAVAATGTDGKAAGGSRTTAHHRAHHGKGADRGATEAHRGSTRAESRVEGRSESLGKTGRYEAHRGSSGTSDLNSRRGAATVGKSGPSTQVGYGETRNSFGKSGGPKAAHHRAHHGAVDPVQSLLAMLSEAQRGQLLRQLVQDVL